MSENTENLPPTPPPHKDFRETWPIGTSMIFGIIGLVVLVMILIVFRARWKTRSKNTTAHRMPQSIPR